MDATCSAAGCGAVDFPKSIDDLHGFATKVLSCGEELSADHPGFTDAAYRARRADIAALARSYGGRGPLPRIEYTPEELATWRTVYTRLHGLFPTHACKAHREIFVLLEQECGYGPDAIPQLEVVSRFLRGRTGFRLRPVTGLLSSRDFLAGLAFRVFHSTQYVRHASRPLYTPEPDVCHELLGHVPLLADASFASFSQEIGLASLGASDAAIERLATIYWFTVEFGLCAEDGSVRAYGAGVLSSYGELLYSLPEATREASIEAPEGTAAPPEHRPLDVARAAETAYPITSYQPVYYVASSFGDAQAQVREYASRSLGRAFTVRIDPWTMRATVVDSVEALRPIVSSLRSEIASLSSSLEHMQSL